MTVIFGESLETKGRKDKGVSVVYDLPRNPDFLGDLVKELKKACACGGAVGDTTGPKG